MMPGSFTFALQFLNKQSVDDNTYTVHKINLSIKDFFTKYDQIRRIYITFTEEIVKERVRFFFAVLVRVTMNYSGLFWYQIPRISLLYMLTCCFHSVYKGFVLRM